jgi:hypothetical protein
MLRCEECGREARTAKHSRGWRAVLTTELADADAEETGHARDGEEVPAVALYCPECAEREFG